MAKVAQGSKNSDRLREVEATVEQLRWLGEVENISQGSKNCDGLGKVEKIAQGSNILTGWGRWWCWWFKQDF